MIFSSQARGPMKNIPSVFSGLIGVLCLFSVLSGEESIILKEPGKAVNLVCSGDRLYVAEYTRVHVYELPGGKFIRTFISYGDGPGQIRFKIQPRPDEGQLVVNDEGKILFFSRDGEYRDERRSDRNLSLVMPLGQGFAGLRRRLNTETLERGFNIEIMTPALETAKVLRSCRSYGGTEGGRLQHPVIEDFLEILVYKNRIYAADSQRGFSITVFDAAGKELYEIVRPFEPVPVSREYKEDYLARMKKKGFCDNPQRPIDFIFPAHWPVFERVEAADDRLWIFTSRIRGEGEKEEQELIVLDLEGKEMKRRFIPHHVPLASISGGALWRLEENAEKEAWELKRLVL